MTATDQATVSVLIVDDHPAVREALATRIAQAEGLKVCGEAVDVAGALRLVDETNPDLAVIDIALKGGSGIDLIKRVKERNSHVRMLVWSMHSDDLYAERALRAGAMGYITKEQATDQIIAALKSVLAGHIYLRPAMAEKLLNGTLGQVRNPIDTLSDRELEVLRLIGEGRRTAEVAAQLHLSIKTVEKYRDRIRRKLYLDDGLELARYALCWVMEGN